MARGRITATALIVIAAAPLVVASWLYYSGFRPSGQTNEGVLLNPIVTDASLNWTVPVRDPRLDDGRFNSWVLVVLDGEAATENLVLSRQVVTALGRESERMSRLYLVDVQPNSSAQQALDLDHPNLAVGTADVASLIATLIANGAPDTLRRNGGLVLADPLGNLVLVYDNNDAGKALLKDFKRLLKASKIG
ncbi:hypothetical protein GH975_00830 [Litorivicinus lipolyticus]|uniref:Cytochrome oxidase Cu insertion factor, SCO1/SenC/PrrC family n=1 Tax=Litorivicinus lipolyticus TaxID=418701 RepID=A0A5Q2Q639_9GAMM|nr:hypothetical protein [Litorivicinus lipolyticus]QGG79178.1 hypothetical protein GH975_00830 [Litorivicinus lipolyticus]